MINDIASTRLMPLPTEPQRISLSYQLAVICYHEGRPLLETIPR